MRFEIIVRGESNDHDETIRGIRQLLKRLGRNYGLKCEIVRPIKESKTEPNDRDLSITQDARKSVTESNR